MDRYYDYRYTQMLSCFGEKFTFQVDFLLKLPFPLPAKLLFPIIKHRRNAFS